MNETKRVAVIAVAVAGVDTGFPGDALDRQGQISVRAEHVGHLVGGVDEGKDPKRGKNCWRSACTNNRVKWLNPATDPDTSHNTTNSGRARGAVLRSTRSIGTPPGRQSTCASVLAQIDSPRPRARRLRAASRVARGGGPGAAPLCAYRAAS